MFSGYACVKKRLKSKGQKQNTRDFFTSNDKDV